MIVDVHTHLPTHQNKVPESEMVTEEMMRSGKSVNLTNSVKHGRIIRCWKRLGYKIKS